MPAAARANLAMRSTIGCEVLAVFRTAELGREAAVRVFDVGKTLIARSRPGAVDLARPD